MSAKKTPTHLKILRLKKGLTQAELGLKLGAMRDRVGFWENALQVPRLEYQIRISRFFNIPLHELQKKCDWPVTPGITVDLEVNA